MNELADYLLDVEGDADCFDPVYEQAMLDALELGLWSDEQEEWVA